MNKAAVIRISFSKTDSEFAQILIANLKSGYRGLRYFSVFDPRVRAYQGDSGIIESEMIALPDFGFEYTDKCPCIHKKAIGGTADRSFDFNTPLRCDSQRNVSVSHF